MKQTSNASLSTPNPLDQEDGFWSFPGKVCLIEVENGTYACNNFTLPDGDVINGLSCFEHAEDAAIYMALPQAKGLNGQVVDKSFQEARAIAKSKLLLHSLVFFRNGRIVDYHFVR